MAKVLEGTEAWTVRGRAGGKLGMFCEGRGGEEDGWVGRGDGGNGERE